MHEESKHPGDDGRPQRDAGGPTGVPGSFPPFKVEVTDDRGASWASNALRFDTRAEAETYAKDLFHRWLSLDAWRVVGTGKAPEMERELEQLGRKMFGTSRSEAMKSSKCVCCGAAAERFRDELSRKEWGISGLCQTCQDDVFDRDGSQPWQQELT